MSPAPRKKRRGTRFRTPPAESLAKLKAAAMTVPEEERWKADVGARVKQVRLELGLSQRELAAVFNRSQPWARAVEGAWTFAPPWLLAALARASRRTVDWFYFGDGEGSGEAQ